MPIQIIINGENAVETLKELSSLAGGFATAAPVEAVKKAEPKADSDFAPTQTPAQVPVAPTSSTTPVVPAAQEQLAQAPPATPPAAPAPTAPTAPAPANVPTSAPSYTMEQLGVAAGPLVDAGRADELLAWLRQRGANQLSQLDKEHYGDFAAYLRSLGAKI